jgi:hypothetical protein
MTEKNGKDDVSIIFFQQSSGNRVTRGVCEKIAQNVIRPIFCQNKYMTLTLEKYAQN